MIYNFDIGLIVIFILIVGYCFYSEYCKEKAEKIAAANGWNRENFEEYLVKIGIDSIKFADFWEQFLRVCIAGNGDKIWKEYKSGNQYEFSQHLILLQKKGVFEKIREKISRCGIEGLKDLGFFTEYYIKRVNETFTNYDAFFNQVDNTTHYTLYGSMVKIIVSLDLSIVKQVRGLSGAPSIEDVNFWKLSANFNKKIAEGISVRSDLLNALI